jgi:hypothetical protein
VFVVCLLAAACCCVLLRTIDREVYQDSSKSLSLNEKKEFVTDQSSVFTYYTWSRHATPKAAADEGGGGD